MLCTLRFFSSKCSLFHNANFFGSCIIHILYIGCAEIKKNNNNSGAKGLSKVGHRSSTCGPPAGIMQPEAAFVNYVYKLP